MGGFMCKRHGPEAGSLSMEVIGFKPVRSGPVDGATSAAGLPMVGSDAGFALDAGPNGIIQVPGNTYPAPASPPISPLPPR